MSLMLTYHTQIDNLFKIKKEHARLPGQLERNYSCYALRGLISAHVVHPLPGIRVHSTFLPDSLDAISSHLANAFTLITVHVKFYFFKLTFISLFPQLPLIFLL